MLVLTDVLICINVVLICVIFALRWDRNDWQKSYKAMADLCIKNYNRARKAEIAENNWKVRAIVAEDELTELNKQDDGT